MKNMFKLKNLIFIFIGIIIGTLGYVVADDIQTIMNANQVGYSNTEKTEKTNVQAAIDELYEHANTYCPKRNPYSITNLIPYGSFEDNLAFSKGTSISSLYSSSEKYYGSKSLYLTVVDNVEGYVETENLNELKKDHKYYYSVMYKGGPIYLLYYSTNYSTNGIISGQSFSDASNWTKASVFIDNPLATGSMSLLSDIVLRLAITGNNNLAYFDGVIFVDLTDTFGAGNEPDREWCDENIQFFDGATIIYK